MVASSHDLIAAVASAAGAAERAIVRLSGARTGALVGKLCSARSGGAGFAGERSALVLAERRALPAWLHDGVSALPVTILWMPGPRSFTAEDVAEIHLPGHPELVKGVMACVLAMGARMAEPGEFTRRAFENGRIDLTRAEGVAALVCARSAAERRAATALLLGGLETRIRSIRDDLERVRALSEASLDFDEADTGHVPVEALTQLAEVALGRLREAQGWERQRTADGASSRVVLAGEPNAGKSTLFNRLVDASFREAAGPALVSDLSGTTRDAKRGEWSLGDGATASLIDTAGLGADAPADSEPDRLALEAARGAIQSADLVLWLREGAVEGPQPGYLAGLPEARILAVRTKVDLDPAVDAGHGGELRISAGTGEGLDGLRRAVRERLGLAEGAAPMEAPHGGATDPQALGARHLAALEAAALRATAALGALRAGVPLDLIAEDLRLATDQLDEIAGRTVPEDLLDRIFAQFCLGK